MMREGGRGDEGQGLLIERGINGGQEVAAHSRARANNQSHKLDSILSRHDWRVVSPSLKTEFNIYRTILLPKQDRYASSSSPFSYSSSY